MHRFGIIILAFMVTPTFVAKGQISSPEGDLRTLKEVKCTSESIRTRAEELSREQIPDTQTLSRVGEQAEELQRIRQNLEELEKEFRKTLEPSVRKFRDKAEELQQKARELEYLKREFQKSPGTQRIELRRKLTFG